MTHPWRSEISLSLWALFIALWIGWLQESWLVPLWLFIAVLLARHIYFTYRLLAWLRTETNQPPDGNGVWEEIFHRLRLMRRRHQRRKRRLMKMLKRFRQATEALPDATVVLTKEFEIDWFNKAAGRMLGLKPIDLGMRIDNLIRQPMFVSYLHKGNFRHPISISAPHNENIRLEVRIVPFTGNQYLLIAQDVTQIQMLERQRRDFVANVSHELRTPVTVIRGYLENLLDQETSVDPALRPTLTRMEEQLQRLQYLVDDLLYLSRLETTPQGAKPRPVNVGDLLTDICREMESVPEPHASIHLQIDSQAKLLGEKQELRSAFENLITNAVKYTPASGKITVHWFETSHGACLEVSDTGEGIPQQHLARITERFYRVPETENRNPTGTGLGLAIVKHVLNRHEGHLSIKSQLGKGSSFRCYFPDARVIKEPMELEQTTPET